MTVPHTKSPRVSKVMQPNTVRVVAPSRLHFGLLSFGGEGRQFGGVGVMIERPGLEVRIAAAGRLEASGLLAERAIEAARRWAAFESLSDEPHCRIEVCRAPRQHTGLGVGTQLSLAVAAGLYQCYERAMPSPVELALSVGRGLRSAVGTYGFAEGGLIVERGKLPGELVSPIDCRLEVPSDWRFVLLCSDAAAGLSGGAEQCAFAELPPVPPKVTSQLASELRERMLPALAQGHFADFSESVYQYGRAAGSCFATRQGGPFNGPRLQQLVERVRGMGVRGVGQSSWGPTIFALLPNQRAAEDFAAQFAKQGDGEGIEIVISPPDNQGARVTRPLRFAAPGGRDRW